MCGNQCNQALRTIQQGETQELSHALCLQYWSFLCCLPLHTTHLLLLLLPLLLLLVVGRNLGQIVTAARDDAPFDLCTRPDHRSRTGLCHPTAGTCPADLELGRQLMTGSGWKWSEG
jgi:hypothetical protein